MTFDYTVLLPYIEKFLWMIGLMLLDVIGGSLMAILVTKDFQWEKLPSFLQKYVPYIFGWLVFVFLGSMPAEYSKSVLNGLAYTEQTVYILIMAGVGASLLSKIAQLGVFPGGFSRIGIGDGSTRKDIG